MESSVHAKSEVSAPRESRKERDRRRREEDLLRAAERLFSERGYDGTSMEDIAREAEYATGTIYRYFASKEALFHQLLLDKGRRFFAGVLAVLDEPASPRDRLMALIRGKVEFFFANREFMGIYFGNVAGSGTTFRVQPPEEIQSLHEAYLERLREVFREGMAAGQFRELDVEMVQTVVTGLTTELLHRSLEEDFKATADEVVAFVEAFLRGGLIRKRGSRG